MSMALIMLLWRDTSYSIPLWAKTKEKQILSTKVVSQSVGSVMYEAFREKCKAIVKPYKSKPYDVESMVWQFITARGMTLSLWNDNWPTRMVQYSRLMFGNQEVILFSDVLPIQKISEEPLVHNHVRYLSSCILYTLVHNLFRIQELMNLGNGPFHQSISLSCLQ